MSKMRAILIGLGVCALGTAGIFYLTEQVRKSNHEDLKYKYRNAYETNKEKSEAIAKILKQGSDSPPK